MRLAKNQSIIIRVRSAILVFLTHKIALPMLKLSRNPSAFPYTKEELKTLPQGSLGNDLYNFLEERKLKLLTHYARHDLKHIVLQFDTTDEGEACLQTFMLGNGRISFPVLATVIYSFITMPEHWRKMRLSYQMGRSCPPFHHWDWNGLLMEDTGSLRERIFADPGVRSQKSRVNSE